MFMVGKVFYIWMVRRIIIPKNKFIFFILEMIAIAQMREHVIIYNYCLVKFQQFIVLKTDPNPKIHTLRGKDFLLIPFNIYTF